jgi:hypothetical protein
MSLFLCSQKLYANSPKNFGFSLKVGQATPSGSPYSFYPLPDLWKNGISITTGFQLPISIFAEYIEFWANGRYAYFGFDKSSQFPIEYYSGSPAIVFNGNDISIYYLYLQILFNLRNPAKTFVPYFGLNYGYFHRSKTVLRSNSPIMEYSEIKFADSDAFAMHLGGKVKIRHNLILQFEMEMLMAIYLVSENKIIHSVPL